MRQVIVYPGEDGFWVAECPSTWLCQPGQDKSGSHRQHPGGNRGLRCSTGRGWPAHTGGALRRIVGCGMSRLPRISGRECVRAPERADFHFRRQEGSHIILRRDHPFCQVVVPDHHELDRGTLRALIQSAGLSVDEFVKLL